MKEQLDLACEKARSVDAANADAAIRSMGELARLQKKCDLIRQRTATAESAVTVLLKKLEVETPKTSDLELKNAMLRKKFETLSKTHAETKARLAQDQGETREDLGKKARDCEGLGEKVGKLKNGLATLRDVQMTNEKKI